jgi:Lrp/AsnC family transcriptional regulator for asnA, asnC and gidA
MGYGHQAMVGVNVRGDPKVVAEQIAEFENADYVVITAGRYDVLVEIFCRDSSEMLQIVGQQLRAIDGVERTEILSYLQLVKQTYDWGTI